MRQVVQAAFGQRRKTLVNALGSGLQAPREWVASVVRGLGLSPEVRAERLAPDQFVALAEAYARQRAEPGV